MNELTIIIVENLAEIIGAIISTIFASVVLPWVVNTLIPWLKDKRLFGTVCQCVKAAEKLAESGSIDKAQKKEYVVALLESIGVEITDGVDAMIEAAVIDLDIAIKGGIEIIEGVFEDAALEDSEQA